MSNDLNAVAILAACAAGITKKNWTQGTLAKNKAGHYCDAYNDAKDRTAAQVKAMFTKALHKAVCSK